MEIIWTDTALETYLKVINYLIDYWTMKEMEAFEIDVDQLIERISSFNQICPESKLFGYRKCVIDEQNSLVYHIENDKLLLVTFFDNRSQHSY
jgi:plasmid stabilization system protein ParE